MVGDELGLRSIGRGRPGKMEDRFELPKLAGGNRSSIVCFGGTHCGCLCSSARVVAPSEFDVPVIGYDPRPWNGFTDYCLCHPDGTVLAVIEAIRPSYLRGFALRRDHK
jgi:hypothetical protein